MAPWLKKCLRALQIALRLIVQRLSRRFRRSRRPRVTGNPLVTDGRHQLVALHKIAFANEKL